LPSHKTITVLNQTWDLLPEKAVYWRDTETLIIADLHLGKAGHFRKEGIAAPGRINRKNLDRLTELLNRWQPESLLILGDLFHSSANREWFEFEDWRMKYRSVMMRLINGNHDVLHHSFYRTAEIDTFPEMVLSGFSFRHDPQLPQNKQSKNVITVAGHLHPGITIRGKGRQSLRLPCFHFTEKQILLPAFGEFTGLHRIRPDETDRVFAVVDNRVLEINL